VENALGVIHGLTIRMSAAMAWWSHWYIMVPAVLVIFALAVALQREIVKRRPPGAPRSSNDFLYQDLASGHFYEVGPDGVNRRVEIQARKYDLRSRRWYAIANDGVSRWLQSPPARVGTRWLPLWRLWLGPAVAALALVVLLSQALIVPVYGSNPVADCAIGVIVIYVATVFGLPSGYYLGVPAIALFTGVLSRVIANGWLHPKFVLRLSCFFSPLVTVVLLTGLSDYETFSISLAIGAAIGLVAAWQTISSFIKWSNL
jgi:hypothetical protein